MQSLYIHDAYCSDEQYTNQTDCETGGEVWTPEQAKVYKALQASVLDYVRDRYTYDEDGNITGTQTKQWNWLTSWAGQAPWVAP